MIRVFAALPPYLSLKPYIGHTLGGCGVAELLLLFESVNVGFVPASLDFAPLDDEFDQVPIAENLVLDSGIFMLNYFGFGGNNSSLIIERAGS
jgi:3-oxoacyl-[acyl-carrier-protein] synthase-1